MSCSELQCAAVRCSALQCVVGKVGVDVVLIHYMYDLSHR